MKLAVLLSLTLMTACGGVSKSNKRDSPSETADPLVKALASGKESSPTLNGKANHTYTFSSPVAENNDNTSFSTVSTNITADAWSLSILDDGEGKVKTTETYFKDANGLLAEEYLKADNTVGLTPILTYGSTTNYDKEFANPFLLLEASDFVKEEDGYHVKGFKATDFVYRIFNESFGAPVGAALAIIGDNFISMLYEYLNISAMECFQSHLTTFELSDIDENSFKIHVASVTPGNGFTLKAESYLKVDPIGTCKPPFDLYIRNNFC